MKEYLKSLWCDDYIEISINKKVLFLIIIVFGLLKLKNYFWMQGALFGYEAGKQEYAPKDDTDTGNVGHLDHSKDNPKI